MVERTDADRTARGGLDDGGWICPLPRRGVESREPDVRILALIEEPDEEDRAANLKSEISTCLSYTVLGAARDDGMESSPAPPTWEL